MMKSYPPEEPKVTAPPVTAQDGEAVILLRILEQQQQQTKYLKNVNTALTIFGVLVLIAAVTTFLPIPRLLEVVADWDAYLRAHSQDGRLAWYTRLGWEGEALDPNDMITPDRKSSGRISSLRQGLIELCQIAGVEYKSPHKARHGHGVYGIKRARTMGELKALSQNMMHSNISTTDGTYGNLVEEDVSRILATFTE